MKYTKQRKKMIKWIALAVAVAMLAAFVLPVIIGGGYLMQ